MIKLLLNAYSEFPTPHQGGPNKVIFDIISGIDRTLIEPYYLSKHLFSFIKENRCLEELVNDQLSLKKTLAVKLIKKSFLFKKIVTNPIYLKYHFYKTNSFYNSIDPNKLKYDVFHSHDAKSFSLLSSKVKCKKILTIHSKGPIKDDLADYFGNSKILADIYDKFDLMEDEAISEADVITFPSYAALELFRSRKRIREEKTKVIYNGIDLNFIQKINTSISFGKIFQIDTDKYLKIINIADHIEPKNIDLILSAIYELIKKIKIKILFINVGTGPLTKKYLSIVKEFDISSNVKFLGNIKNEDVITLMKDADYLLQPSQRVIFDYVILEALACGTTVITSNEGGNMEIISDFQNGFLLQELNVKEIIKIIIQSNKISKNDMNDTIDKFKKENVIKNYQSIYLD